MPATIISAATLTNAAGPGASFTPTAPFGVACIAGTVGVQIEVESGVWYDYVHDNDFQEAPMKIRAKEFAVVPVLFTGANYRLVAPEGRTTARAYALS